MRVHRLQTASAALAVIVIATAGVRATAAPGDTLQTPDTPMELPIEVEIELSPAGSLKQAPLWKEMYQLLTNPGAVNCDPGANLNEPNVCLATIPRRPGFGVAMPQLKVWNPNYNFLTGQPLRLRSSDGEVSWDQPGPLFDTDEDCLVPGSLGCDAFNTPTVLRTPIGHVVACPNTAPGYQAAVLPAGFCTGKPTGSLVVYNHTGSPVIPPNGTVIAVAAVVAGVPQELDGTSTTATVPLEEFEIPINEEDFFRPTSSTAGVPAPLRPYIGRTGAEVLGKALFWDMQVGSDGVQSCASCHFNGGADNRTRNQLNPNSLGGDDELEVASAFKSPTTNVAVVPTDFPFHSAGQDVILANDPTDANDVMSSMGVSRFKQFVDVPVGATAFLAAVSGVAALRPDIACGDAGTTCVAPADPIAIMQGVRRVEPRNTPTFHGAAFNFDNFWDGRARFIFNGGSVFGPSDPTAHIFVDPGNPNGAAGVNLQAATNGHVRPELITDEPEIAEQPVRIKFSSLASQAVGPPLSNFEMSFDGRNWAKIGKKLLQGDTGGQDGIQPNEVTPLANQLVHTADSRLGPFSNQGGSVCTTLSRPTAVGKPGLCISYGDLIRLAFAEVYWHNSNRHLDGCYTDDGDPNTFQNTPACAAGTTHDPFDGYVLTNAAGAASAANTNQFRQVEANFTLFFGLAVQAYESLTIPDHTPADRFFDANPFAGHGVGEPGDQAVLFPTLIPGLIADGQLGGPAGFINLIGDDPATPWYDAFGPDEVFGFDLFAGANLTAALRANQATDPRSGRNRNPQVTNSMGQTIRVGSNPFTRSAKCMLCHLGPEQTDHSINIAHGVLKNDAEFEYPTPPSVADPTSPPTFADGLLPSPEPSGSSRAVVGHIQAEEIGEGVAQDAVEVEPRNFATFDDPATPWDDRIVAQESNFAFGDQGVYNVGVRPIDDDIGRGGDDPFGWPLSLSALTLKNIGGANFEPCRGLPGETLASCAMSNIDPENLEASFEETGDGETYPGTTLGLQSINPGFERDPIVPRLPEYMVPWIHSLPAGELHPQIDEMAGMVPNTVTIPNGGPAIEFPEILFGADFHCARYDPAVFGNGPPNFGWGPPDSDERLCPQHQSGVAGNFAFPSQGTWPVPNRIMGDGAFKAPPLRNVELTGPFFHTGSFLTLRQVVDFYFEGGDFPRTNSRSRDPHIVNLEEQAFAFGPSQGGNLIDPFDCSAAAPNDAAFPLVAAGCGSFGHLIGSFGDGLPDTAFLYDHYPDSNHPITPEPTFASRATALEDAKTALVKFLLALTDPRVKLERAPFDHPELFVPIDGAAPENLAGRGTTAVAGGTTLVSLSGVACPVPGPGSGPTVPCFQQIPAVGAAGITTPVAGFLGVTAIPPGSPGFTCDVSDGAAMTPPRGVSHFCAEVTP